jgi:hypothetical protein
VFAVDRDHPGSGLGGPPHHQRAGHHERLLVGQGDGLARFYRRPGASQPGRPRDRRYDPVNGGIGQKLVEGLGARGEAGPGRQRGGRDLGGGGRVGHHQPAGPELAGLVKELLRA